MGLRGCDCGVDSILGVSETASHVLSSLPLESAVIQDSDLVSSFVNILFMASMRPNLRKACPMPYKCMRASFVLNSAGMFASSDSTWAVLIV